jgi:hypothetical protein
MTRHSERGDGSFFASFACGITRQGGNRIRVTREEIEKDSGSIQRALVGRRAIAVA